MSRDKKLQVRASQEWLDWFDAQIKAHGLDQNRSEIVTEAVELFFKNQSLKKIDIPPELLRRVTEFVRTRSTKTNESSVVIASIMDYLDRH